MLKKSKHFMYRRGAPLIMLFCWFALLRGAYTQTPGTEPQEVLALRDIKNSFIDPSGKLSNWNSGDPCTSSWTGVICFERTMEDDYLHVRELQLLNMNLSGTLSPSLGRLTYMRILDFMWNEISGSIPAGIGDMKSLQLLLLNGNQLTGSLPEEIGHLPNLDRLQIDENRITGPIPKSFANLNQITHIHMNNNSISGQIPPELSELESLVGLLLDNNKLTGYLPPQLAEIPNLRILQLDNNNFDGSVIPASYVNMSRLLKLSLRNCSLQGSIPDLSRIPSLAYIDLSSNQLKGSIPSNKLFEAVTTIDLSNNLLTGIIPANFSKLPRLQLLSLANNSLNGSVASNIWEDRILKASEGLILNLQNNNISSISGNLNLPPKVALWLQGNPVCTNSILVDFCISLTSNNTNSQSPRITPADCPGCPTPYEYAWESPVPCFCAAPLIFGYRLKSPGFSDFLPYLNSFNEYLTTGLNVELFQLNVDSFVWEKGPRLRMSLKIYPVYTGSNSNIFNRSEVNRILDMFTRWNIPESNVFGPYEFLDYTLSEPYKEDSGGVDKKHAKEVAPSGKHRKFKLKIEIASGVVGGSILLLLVLIIYYRRMTSKNGSSLLFQNVSSHPKDVDAFIRQYGASIPKRYKYSRVKKITNSFKDELGKGGYGNVYRGNLADGRVVAVKVLNPTKGNGEEFINEVASIGRTSHVNVVTLLGFCYEGKKRALIYEFMPNGSLEKFIYGTTPLLEGQHLGWEKLYSIAIGIARGLEYLHQGCNTRILHFDIKPHNILLDEDFCPKISDFGLAKLYTRKESAVSSLFQARGTVGYIAPEVISRNFGQVSHKSDVYSYGMMILEMVGGRKNVNAGADHTSEIYYPRWLYKRIQSDDALNLANEISKEENELARKMVIVGFWCIQTYPLQRPSIGKVIEMLEGQIAALEIPPNPYLCSAPSSPSDSQTKPALGSPSEIESISSSL